MSTATETLRALLESKPFSYATLEELERICFELAHREPENSEVHAALSTLGLAAYYVGHKLRTNAENVETEERLVSTFQPLFCQAVRSLNVADIYSISTAIIAGALH